ncbi:MAG TPA: TonB-dependent receptor [Acidobacteriota bacterium]|nr:TonB-dependent receptor [Acidobacteriota bacterium]
MFCRRRNETPLILVLLVLFSNSPAGAQALSTIRGTVTDQSKALIPGAEIVVTEVATNVTVRRVLSDDNGFFEVPDVKPGTYQLTASLPGFKTFLADGIVLEGAQVRRIDIVLEIGEVTEQVTVNAGAAVIRTDGGDIALGVSGKIYDEKPLVRNYYPHSLLVTLAGVESQNSGWNLRLAGQPPSQVALGMDGVTNDGTVNLVNRMDFSEINVVAVGNQADQARVGQYNMVSKRGGNEFHGHFYYTHYNSALNARNFFDPEKPTEKEHQSQLAFSGPIIPEKTFFYASYFYLDLPAGSFHQRTVPTNQMRQGDFSQFPDTIIDPLTGQPFSGKVIPSSRINPTSARIQELIIPTPNLGGPDTMVSNFGFLHPFPSDLITAHYPMVRIDHNLTENNTLYGRFIRRYTPYVTPGSFPNYGTRTRERDHRAWAFSDTHVFSPQLVNSFRFGWKTDFIEDGTEVEGIVPPRAADIIQQIGLQGVNQRNFDSMGGPAFSITGMSGISIPGGGVVGDDHLTSYANSLTWTKGRHVWKFGGELKRQSTFQGAIPADTFGSFNFDGSFTGNPYSDFLLGLPRTASRLDPLVDRTRVAYEFGVYAMDSFKISNRLTIDYGLRWDYFSAASYEDGLQYNWDRETGNVIVSSEALGQVSPLYPSAINIVTGEVLPDSDMGNFRPRIGLAYRLSDQMVLRGGYGVFTEQIGYFSRLQGGGPFQISESYLNAIENGQPRFSFPNPFPSSLSEATVPSQSISGYPDNTDNGSIHQFHFSLERQFGDVGLRLSYIGSRSRGLNYNLNLNKPQPSEIPFTEARRPYPQFVSTVFAQSNGAQNYDSFQIEGQRKVGAFTFDAHYTLQSNMNNFSNLENPYNPNQWNHEQWAARHRAVVTTMIDLPWGRGRRFLADAPPAVDAVVGGWRMTTVSFFQSGQRFTPSFSGSDPSNTGTFGGVPDRVCDGNLESGQQSVERWFDTSCFQVPALGRFGNSGVNILEGPGLHLHHLSLTKEIAISERFTLKYIAGISNLFNQPQFDFPRTNISASDPGRITQIRVGADLSMEKTRARQMEMTLRLEW